RVEPTSTLAAGVDGGQQWSLGDRRGGSTLQLSQNSDGLDARDLEEVRPDGEGLDELRAFWDESARVDALRAVASGDTPDTVGASGLPDLPPLREFLHPEATAVEIGCGIGRILQHVAPLCRQATGYDISPGMIKI